MTLCLSRRLSNSLNSALLLTRLNILYNKSLYSYYIYGISRQTVVQYLHYLEKARLINTLHATGASISTLQKPHKIFLENPNLHYALTTGECNRGSLRESFVLNQLKNAKHDVSLPDKGDFLVDRSITLEVGGKNKGKKQVSGIDHAFIAADDLEIGIDNKIPLWLFGMLY